MTLIAHELQKILDDIKYPDRRFIFEERADHGFNLQVVYDEKDVDTGKVELQKSRKWFVSSHAQKSEVVRTCFAMVMMSFEHVIREHFKYRDAAIFGPHFDVDKMVELISTGDVMFEKGRDKPMMAAVDKAVDRVTNVVSGAISGVTGAFSGAEKFVAAVISGGEKKEE